MKTEKFLVHTPEAMIRLMSYVGSLPWKKNLPYEVVIRRVRPKRTEAQNAFIHIVFRRIAEFTGHTEDEIKEDMKERFLEKRALTIGTQTSYVLPSTESLEVDEMSGFIDNVLDFAADELNLVIERPGEIERIG